MKVHMVSNLINYIFITPPPSLAYRDTTDSCKAFFILQIQYVHRTTEFDSVLCNVHCPKSNPNFRDIT